MICFDSVIDSGGDTPGATQLSAGASAPLIMTLYWMIRNGERLDKIQGTHKEKKFRPTKHMGIIYKK